MSAPDHQDCNCGKLLADRETWDIILEPAFCNDPGAAESFAHLLFILKKEIASGPEGSMRVINTLQDGIRMVWPYTEEHKMARELYEIYLSGELKPWDEPRQLLGDALQRAKGESAKGKPKSLTMRPIFSKRNIRRLRRFKTETVLPTIALLFGVMLNRRNL